MPPVMDLPVYRRGLQDVVLNYEYLRITLRSIRRRSVQRMVAYYAQDLIRLDNVLFIISILPRIIAIHFLLRTESIVI